MNINIIIHFSKPDHLSSLSSNDHSSSRCLDVNCIAPTVSALEKTATHSAARVNKQTQFNNTGLIILRALYGDIIEFGEQITTAYKPGKCVDISMELQANCDPINSSLIVQQVGSAPLFQRLKDISNPNSSTKNKLIRNRLAVVYYFHGEMHYALYEDHETIILPIQEHQCSQIPNDGTLPDLPLSYYPEWTDLIPSFDQEDVFEIVGTEWDIDCDYKNIPYEYKQMLLMRPEGIYFEPKLLVYERLLKLEEKRVQKNLLLGFGIATLTIFATLQYTGFINVRRWPGFNIFSNQSIQSTSEDNQ